MMWRWPVVSRYAHHALMAAKDERIADRDATIAQLRADLLVAQDRERMAFVKGVQPQTPNIVLPSKKEPSVVDTAIALKASGDRQLRSYFKDFAQRQRMEGMADEEIAARIIAGDPVGDDEGIDD
jgi:hypothetical protein